MVHEKEGVPMFNFITSRSLSLLVVLAYAAFALFGGSHRSATAAVGAVLLTLVYMLMPLACIWFGEEMGDYIGSLPGPAINRRTPGWMVKIGGWFLLLLPVIIFLFSFLNSWDLDRT